MAVRRSESMLEPIVLHSNMYSVNRGWYQQSSKSDKIIPLHGLSGKKEVLILLLYEGRLMDWGWPDERRPPPTRRVRSDRKESQP
jgi:hypothetical protein